MAEKWTMHEITEKAIVRLEEQSKDSELSEYGTPEHLAVIRYGVMECCDSNGVLDKEKLKSWFSKESAFLGYASNAKKMLASIDNGKAYPKLASKEKVSRGYE